MPNCDRFRCHFADDHTLTLEEATDEMQSLDDMLIFGEPVTRIYPAGDMEEVDA